MVEILQYTLKKDSGREFHRIMDEISIPLHKKHSFEVIYYGNSLHDKDCYCLIRAFASEEKMTEDLEAFYSSDDWKKGPREEIIDRIDQSIRTVLTLSENAVEILKKEPFR